MAEPETQSASSGTIREDLVAQLVDMGLPRDAAIAGLFNTGNSDVQAAASWIFENQGNSEMSLSRSADCVKMVFVVNSELGMSPGKMAAQVGHAAVSLYRVAAEGDSSFQPMLITWVEEGGKKVVLHGESAAHLTELASTAQTLSLPHYLVVDAGFTQIPAGSMTVLGLMGSTSVVDMVTGSLSLLP